MSRPLAHIDSLEPRAGNPRTCAHDAAHPEPLPEGTVLRHYRLSGVAHADEFGLVYRATDLEGGADVAIKEFFPSAHAARDGSLALVPRDLASATAQALGLQRRVFDEQSRLLLKLRPGSTPSVLAEWHERRTAYRAMPWIEGTTLAALFASLNGPAGEWVLRSILGPLLGALHALHRHGVQHGRLTPDRVLLTKDVRVLLLGVGAQPGLPATPAVQGRLSADEPYSAPELLGLAGSKLGPLRVGPWSDIYSVGAILHRAITGMPPALTSLRLVQRETASLARIAAGDYDDGFLRAIDSALSMQPEKRPRNVDQFCARLGLGVCRLPAHVATMASQPRETAPGELRFRELPDGLAALLPDRDPARAAPFSRSTSEIPSLSSGFADTEMLDPDAVMPTPAPPAARSTSIWLPLPVPEVLTPEVLMPEVPVPEVPLPKIPVPEVRVIPASTAPAPTGRVAIAPRPSGRGDPTAPYRVVPESASQGRAAGEGVAGAPDAGATLEPLAHGGSVISIMTPSLPAPALETVVVPPIPPTLSVSLDRHPSGRRFPRGLAYALLLLMGVLTALWAAHVWNQTGPRSSSINATRASPRVTRDRTLAPEQASVKAKPTAALAPPAAPAAPASMEAEARSAPTDAASTSPAGEAPRVLPPGAPPAAPAAAVAAAAAAAPALAPAAAPAAVTATGSASARTRAAAPPAASPPSRPDVVRAAAAPRPHSRDARCADRLVRLSLDDTTPSASKTKPQGACP